MISDTLFDPVLINGFQHFTELSAEIGIPEICIAADLWDAYRQTAEEPYRNVLELIELLLKSGQVGEYLLAAPTPYGTTDLLVEESNSHVFVSFQRDKS